MGIGMMNYCWICKCGHKVFIHQYGEPHRCDSCGKVYIGYHQSWGNEVRVEEVTGGE